MPYVMLQAQAMRDEGCFPYLMKKLAMHYLGMPKFGPEPWFEP